MRKQCLHFFSAVLRLILFILAGNDAIYLIHFKFVGIKDTHNIYYLGLSGEHRCPLGYLYFILTTGSTISKAVHKLFNRPRIIYNLKIGLIINVAFPFCFNGSGILVLTKGYMRIVIGIISKNNGRLRECHNKIT